MTDDIIFEFFKKKQISKVFAFDGNDQTILFNGYTGTFHSKQLRWLLDCHHMHCIVIIFGNMYIFPKQCLFRWSYFKVQSNYSPPMFNYIQIFDISNMWIDANENDYALLNRFAYFIGLKHCESIYSYKDDVKSIQNFLGLLVPPRNFWNNEAQVAEA